LINSIASTVTGDNNVRRCKKILYAGPKSARNISTNLSPNPGRSEKPRPTYNSESDTTMSTKYIFRLLGGHHQLCEVHKTTIK